MSDDQIAICWFEREDWPEAKRIFPDPTDLQVTYDAFLDQANDGIADMRRKGSEITLVRFDAQDFARFLSTDGKIHAHERPGKIRAIWAMDRHRRNQHH